MIAIPSNKCAIFGATFGITVFALLIQINSAENIQRHSNVLNTTATVPHNNSDFFLLNSKKLYKDTLELHIIQNIVDNFAAILSSSHHKYRYRYKRGNILPPESSSNSSRLTMLENQLSKMQEQIVYLNSSLSLSNEDKSRISILETTIKEMQTTLDSYQKENSETTQVIINKLETSILIGMIQSIKSGQFSFAEEQLQLTDDTVYKKIVQKIYDHEVENIDLLLRFGGSLTDLEKKFKLYEALYNEIRNNGPIEIQILLQLSSSLRIGILEAAIGTITDKHRSLIFTLWDENRNAAVTLITAAFIKNESWSLVKQIKDEIQRSRGLKFLGDIYKEVMEKVMDALSIENILTEVDQNLNITEERIIIHESMINKLERNRSLHDDSVMILASYMKKTWDDPGFSNQDWRYRYKIIINKLPRSLRNIVLSFSVCIKNSHYNEYLYPTDSGYTFNGYRQVFTRIPKYKHDSPEMKWKMDFDSHFCIKARNVKYNEYLSYYSYGNENKFYSVTDRSAQFWKFIVDGEGVQISHCTSKKYLFVDEPKTNDNMRYAFAYNPTGKPPYPSKWELVDCSDIS